MVHRIFENRVHLVKCILRKINRLLNTDIKIIYRYHKLKKLSIMNFVQVKYIIHNLQGKFMLDILQMVRCLTKRITILIHDINVKNITHYTSKCIFENVFAVLLTLRVYKYNCKKYPNITINFIKHLKRNMECLFQKQYCIAFRFIKIQKYIAP